MNCFSITFDCTSNNKLKKKISEDLVNNEPVPFYS